MDKITVTKQYNRFNNKNKSVAVIDYKKQTALELKNKTMPAVIESDIILNGEIIRNPSTTWIMPNDDITFVPKIESDFFRTILPIILIVASFIIFPGSTLLMIGARIAFVVAGSMLVNAILPPPKPKLPSLGSFDTSPSYSWSGGTTGNPDTPIPLIYGTMQTHGKIISSYLSSDGHKQYLNLLLSIGEGTVSRVYNMKINGQPRDQFDNVVTTVRNGTLTQDVIPSFKTTKKEYTQGITVNSGTPFLYTTPESDFDELEVDITFPQGLWYSNDSGGLDSNSVDVKISYSIDGGTTYTPVTHQTITKTLSVVSGVWSAGYWDSNDPTGAWVEISAGSSVASDHTEGDAYAYGEGGYVSSTWRWISVSESVNTSTPVDYIVESANSTKSITKTIKFNVSNNTTLIKVEKLTADRNNSRYGDIMQVSSIREVYYDDFAYPYEVLVGLKALATNKLSGSFTFDCLVDGKYINTYDGTTWTVAFSNNPAWVCWDVLTQPVMDASFNIVAYRGIDPSRLQGGLPSFKAWADFCDVVLADGTKRATFNGIFDTPLNMWETALKVASVGRANLIYDGVNIQVIIDQQSTLTHPLINVGNTLSGSFKEQFISASQRIGKISVEFRDKSDNNFNRQKVTFYDKDAGDLSHSVTLQPVGITSLNEAKRYALLLLYHNKYTTRSVSLGMDIDSLNYQVGDVIDLQNDVPEWGDGGRIVSATSTTITLDKTITLGADVYKIKIRLSDDTLVEKTIVENNGDYSTVTVSVAFTTIPSQFDPYATYVSTVGLKPFRIVSIATKEDQTAELSMLEYNDSLYSLVDSGVAGSLPSINYSELDVLPSVTGLFIDELWTTLKDGTIGDEIIVRFDHNQNNAVNHYEVWYKIEQTDGTLLEGWQYGGTTNDEAYTLQKVLVGVVYYIAVLTVNNDGAKTKLVDAPQLNLTTLGKQAPPSDVTNFTLSVKDFNIVMKWDNISDSDLALYEIQDSSGTVIHSGKQNTFLYHMTIAGSYTFSIKAIDTSGNYSTNWTSANIIVAVPSAVANLITAINGVNYSLSWDNAVPTDFPIQQYKITYGSSRTLIGYIKTTTFSEKANWVGSRNFYVSVIDQAGNEGSETVATLNISAPPITTITITVIDNFALLKWDSVVGTLPIDFYEVRKGTTFATATVIAQQKGNFLTDFETSSGDYTFWVVGVDSAGNYGTEVSQTAHISQPPNYVLNVDWVDDFSGTKTNVMVDYNNFLLGSVNTTETWADHFVNNGWNTPQDQIDAGYSIYIEPAETSGSYSQTFDYGAVLSSTKITVNTTSNIISGSPAYTITISTRKLATDAWTVFPTGNSVYATNFQYVKVDLALTGTATDLIEITKLECRLDSKLIDDAGVATVNSADTGGTTIYFNVAFTDVTSITVSAIGSTDLSAVYTFTSIPNPPSFQGYLFDTGVRASGDIAWQAKGY